MQNIKPATFTSVFMVFFSTMLFIIVGVYIGIPLLYNKGVPFFLGYLFCFQIAPFVFLFGLMIYLYIKEGNPLNFKDFPERMRLVVSPKIIVFGILLLIFGVITYVALQSLTVRIAQISFLALPDWFAPDIHPLKTAPAGTFMGMSLKGAYWAPILYLAGWFLNIFGEELLFRGYLLPQMELKYKKAWLVNGLFWIIWHAFWWWQLPALLPFVIALPFVAQKTKSTVPGLIAHGGMNIIAVIMIILTVLGMK